MSLTNYKRELIEPGVILGEWHHRLEDGRVQCDLCPRFCKLHDGQRGFCYVREARDGEIYLTSYGRASGYCIDPIEKKPLNHFYPGSSVLSFGTAGCNLGCRYCQNWDISKARDDARLSAWADPEGVSAAAEEHDCKSVAFTYNDPIVFAEYAIDCAIAAHQQGLKTVVVSSGYMTPAAREEFYVHMDAVNIDLKAFTEGFYHKLCFAALEPVLDTLIWLKRQTSIWLEITTLLIPGHNDSEDEVALLSDWVIDNLGPDTPLHFSAFHPSFKMNDTPPTPPETVIRARQQALEAGLHYVYTGNIHDAGGQSTYCPYCKERVIERDWYRLGEWRLDEDGRCEFCDTPIAGRFDTKPGSWGARRELVDLGQKAA